MSRIFTNVPFICYQRLSAFFSVYYIIPDYVNSWRNINFLLFLFFRLTGYAFSNSKSFILLFICLHIIGISAPASSFQDGLGKGQFDKQIKKIVNQINNEENKYKSIEKDVLTYFPKGTRKSPFYLVIRNDFLDYRKIMKSLDKIKKSLTEDQKKYKSQFSLGMFKSVEILRDSDEKWSTAKSLSERISVTLLSAPGEINKLPPLNQNLSQFVKKLAEVLKFQDELKSAIKQTDKEYEKVTVTFQNLNSEFLVKYQDITTHKVYKNGEALKNELEVAIKHFSATFDSMKSNNKTLQYLLKGASKSGDHKVWDRYKTIVNGHAGFTLSILESARTSSDLLGKFKTILDLLDEFSDVLIQFDKEIKFIESELREGQNKIQIDSTRFGALLLSAPPDSMIEKSPFVYLAPSFEKASKTLMIEGNLLEKVQDVRRRFVVHAGTMDGLKTDENKYKDFKYLQKVFKSVKGQALDQINEFYEMMKQFWKFFELFDNELKKMDSDLAELNSHSLNSNAVLELDRKSFSSLFDDAPVRSRKDEFPYTDLKTALDQSVKILITANEIAGSTVDLKQRFIEHVGTMDGLKSDNEKYNTFLSLQKNFDETKKDALKKYKEYLKASDAFKEIVFEHFLNTPQYWELKYKVERRKSFRGDETAEENFGYIYDPNEYPEKPYHGKLISQFQLKLLAERSRGRRVWKTTLIFTGQNEYPIEGMRLMSEDSLLYEISIDDVQIKEEKQKDKLFTFTWELPVKQDLMKQISEQNDLVLKIHFLTVTHRIGMTMYRQKMLKEFKIPGERLAAWREMIKEE